MNQKKAKMLRRAAQRATVGAPNRGVVEGKKGARLVPGTPTMGGEPTMVEREITGTIRLIKGCTRAVYRALKRSFLTT